MINKCMREKNFLKGLYDAKLTFFQLLSVLRCYFLTKNKLKAVLTINNSLNAL